MCDLKLYTVKVLCILSLILIRGSDAQRNPTFVRTHLEYMGNYFAGHGQFPWAVEIRTQSSENQSEQHEWSIGNLIGPRYVLTTCNAVAYFDFVGTIHDRYVVKPKKASNYKVMYSPDFPYHGPKWYINRFAVWRAHNTELKTGTRQISRMTPHPFCDPQLFRFFFGIVELGSEPIRPFRLFVNYAPAELDANSLGKKWYRLQTTSAWNTALMATVGRKYNSIEFEPTMLLHYKLRYKVSFQTWDNCERVKDKLAWSAYSTEFKRVNNTYCMQVYDVAHTLNAVCDHDRGAPIVWEDYFVGIVITGATPKYCDLTRPLPFVALSLEDALVYWTNVERHILQYFIDNTSHIFPGLTGLVVDTEGRSISPPTLTSSAIVWLSIGLLLLLLSVIS